MPSPITLRCGLPRRFAARVLAGPSGLDMNTVASVAFRVNSTPPVEWTAILSAQTSSELTATRMVGATECPGQGHYTVTPILTVTDQEWPEEAESFNLTVVQ